MANPKKTPEQRRKEYLENLTNTDKSESVFAWLESCKESSRGQYLNRWALWLEYCKTHGLPTSGDLQLKDMKQRKDNHDNAEKFFYDNEVPKYFQWLKNEYVTKNENQKLLEEGSALSTVTGVRSFFTFHRYPLQIQKGKLPSSDSIRNKKTDYPFNVYTVRQVFNHGNLEERTVLAVGKDFQRMFPVHSQ
jgi:hypothetical protein